MRSTRVLLRCERLLVSRNHSFFVKKGLWTPDNVVISPFKDIKIPSSTIPEHIWNNFEKWAEKTAVICGLSNRSYTYNDVYNLSRTFASNLRKKFGIKDGDIISIMMPNSPEYVIATLGIMDAGAELTTINPIYTPHEVQRQVILSNPKIIIGSKETATVIKEALKLAKKEIPIIVVKNPAENLPIGTVDFFELAKDKNADMDALKEVKRKSEDIAILPFSSGTTGLPKGVELTNRNIVVNCVQQDVDGVKQYQDTTAAHQDAVIALLPFYHIYGLVIVALHKLSVGTRIVTLPKFQPENFISTLKDHRISLLYAAPPMILFLGSHPGCKKEHLQYVRRVLSGAAPLPKQDIFNIKEKIPVTAEMNQLYGLTETAPLATAGVPGVTPYTSAGFAISNTDMKIVNSEGKSLGPDEVGELLIRGPQVMKGYRNNPEANKASFTEDGWFKTGDLSFLDKDGAVTIADRLKELIKVKGFQVPPAELESILKEHPSVLDAGVIGVPDARAGEVPKAFVVLKEGHKKDSEGIKDFVSERVAPFKRINEIVFLDSLPKNPSGKLLRRELKEKYC